VVLARQTATLDHLSGGRVTLGVGSGDFPFEWEYVGEESDSRTRGAMLDEHLHLLDRLWTGEPVRHEGRFYRAAGPEWSAVCFPPPVQRPRIPVWVGGTWPGTRPFVRAARWDGVVPMRTDGPWGVADTAAVAERVRTLRTDPAPFDLAVPGESDGADDGRAQVHADHAGAGATWWVEALYPWREGLPAGLPWPSAVRERIDAGP
jgi:alkanesulfonate monooxygenase SsuD/methylene tetrahydromethanopterin reductase-like flavin-dependent oxidoreductase (luciferase family)